MYHFRGRANTENENPRYVDALRASDMPNAAYFIDNCYGIIWNCFNKAVKENIIEGKKNPQKPVK